MIDLKQRRIELGLTMLEVAKIVGVSEATISRYESGNIQNMRGNKIKRYAEALQVPASSFIDDDENEKNASANNDKSVDELLKNKRTKSKWDAILEELSPENRDRLQEQAELLLLKQQVQADKEEK